jgi:predicted nucleotidyltransferase
MKFDKLKSRWVQKKQESRAAAQHYKQLIADRCPSVFQKFGIDKVVVFGSIIEDRFMKSSDIDMWVQGLPSEEYWSFLHEMEETIGIPIDLYTEKDDQIFVEKILIRGEVVYEV